jgi:hypothetical protein
MGPEPAPHLAILDPLWRQVELNWENEAAHLALLEQCTAPDQLRVLAGRYREQLQIPAHEAVARRQLQAITALAMAQLATHAHARPHSTLPQWLLVGVFLIVSAVLYWCL